MKLWLDDLRPVPYGYEGARSVNEGKTVDPGSGAQWDRNRGSGSGS